MFSAEPGACAISMERGPTERLIARLPPPLDGEIVEPTLREMMRDDFGLARRTLRIVAQVPYAASWTAVGQTKPPEAISQIISGIEVTKAASAMAASMLSPETGGRLRRPTV